MPVHSKIIFFLFLIASRIAVAQGFGGFPGSGGLPSEMPGAAGLTQAPLERYNQLLTPQFKYEKLGENVRILNQIGNGDPTNFYASGQDEAVAYGLLNGNSFSEDMYNPDMGLANQGEYTLFRLVDRCRMEEGCGNIGADGKYFIFGFPTHATNVYPIGRGIIRDSEVYDGSSSVPSGDTVPTTHTHSGWQGRNSIDDGRGFIYGRYLINQASLGNPLEPDVLPPTRSARIRDTDRIASSTVETTDQGIPASSIPSLLGI
ncbi:MAG: hypothetical protein HYW02_05315 [Deltaproteobacteria bacterium]|nr:hypothetical protein [Deltaproteobacteria bacterium]